MAVKVERWQCDECKALYGSPEVANDCANHDRRLKVSKVATATVVKKDAKKAAKKATP